MSSKRRIAASRRNGALSKGPKTAEGKSRSSWNALKHGLLSKRVVLFTEDNDDFEMVLNHYLEKFDPQDGVEMGMVEQMASCFWRLQRSLTIEKELFDAALDDRPEGAEESRLAGAFVHIAFASSLPCIQRYESMLDRMHTRTLKNLLLLRKMQPKNPRVPNEPSPNIGHSETPPLEPEISPEPGEMVAAAESPRESAAESHPCPQNAAPKPSAQPENGRSPLCHAVGSLSALPVEHRAASSFALSSPLANRIFRHC